MGLYGKKERVADTPEAYVDGLPEPRRDDIGRLHARVRQVAPAMAASAKEGMLSYGTYRYKYASGREGEWFVLGIASQKHYISLYAPTLNLEPYLARLPKADIGRGCIRFKRLDDLDLGVIDEVIRASAANDGQRRTS